MVKTCKASSGGRGERARRGEKWRETVRKRREEEGKMELTKGRSVCCHRKLVGDRDGSCRGGAMR